MKELSSAKQLALIATDVDSLEKAFVRAEAERSREAHCRRRADAQAQALRQELQQARRRAKAAERALSDASARIAAIHHANEAEQRELRERLEQAEEAKKVLRHEVEQTERERHALELNLREALANLRHAAERAPQPQAPTKPGQDAPTVLAEGRTDVGW